MANTPCPCPGCKFLMDLHVGPCMPITNETDGPSLDLILECPNCGTFLNAFVPVQDFFPMEE